MPACPTSGGAYRRRSTGGNMRSPFLGQSQRTDEARTSTSTSTPVSDRRAADSRALCPAPTTANFLPAKLSNIARREPLVFA